MAPTAEALEKALRDGVQGLIDERGWSKVTVNNVRQYVEEKGDMEQGFFKTPEWEARSKKIIKDHVDRLLAEESKEHQEATEAEEDSKNGIKRQSSDEPSPAPKRQKKKPGTAPPKRSKPKKEESESELSDLDDESDFEEPPKKTNTKTSSMKEDSDSELSELISSEDEAKKTETQQPASRRKSKKEDSESELSDLDDSDEEPKKKIKTSKKPAPRRKSKNGPKQDEEAASESEGSPVGKKRKRSAPAKKQTTKHGKVESDSGDDLADEKAKVAKAEELSDLDGGDAQRKSKPNIKAKTAPKAEESDSDTKPKAPGDKSKIETNAGDSSSELSSVIDDPPPKKRKSRESKGASKSRRTQEPSGDDAEIKKLQGQLVKCGVRKIWGIELKKYGNDSKGKIRHLKGMLRDVGIDGRFSEAKAKEIKERRELMADLEAVTEMNRNWGSGGGGGRASRSKATEKSLKEDSEEADEEEDAKDEEDNKDEDGVKANPRVSKRMADLAFLGSDNESD